MLALRFLVRRGVELPERTQRAVAVAARQVIGVQQAEVDQLIQAFLFELLRPEDRRQALPTLLQLSLIHISEPTRPY